MARPKKTGLDYFPHDVDSSDDEKLEALEANFGNDGYACYFKLLERIYRNGGKIFIEDEETMKTYAKRCNVSTEIFSKILEFMTRVQLFKKDIWNDEKCLTSKGISCRVKVVANKRVSMKKRYSKNVSAAETLQKHDKVKESKVKESKVTNKEFTHLENEEFSKSFNDYLEMRKKIRKPATDRAKEIALKELHKHDVGIAIKMLENSVMNSYQGIFPLKPEVTTTVAAPKAYVDHGELDKLIESRIGRLATKDMVKKLMVDVPEKFWWKIDSFLKKRYPGGGNGFGEAEREIRNEVRLDMSRLNGLAGGIGR